MTTHMFTTQPVVAAAPVAKSFTPVRAPLLQRKCACGEKPGAKGECEKCKDEHLHMQKRSAVGASHSSAVPPVVHQVLQSPGQPLPVGTRSLFESRFGHDFSQVRVHTDPQAAESARAVNSLAYTVGQDVVFGSGQYAPQTADGQRLLAHELAHTIQQQGMQRYSNGVALSETTQYEQLELEADRAADAVMGATRGSAPASAYLVQHAPAPLISRQTTQMTQPATPPASTAPATATEGPARDWQPLTPHISIGSGQFATERATLNPNVVAFKIDKFLLPAQKGPVLELYRQKAIDGSLEATIDFSRTNPQAGLWQQREVTANLRENWFLKVGWPAAQAATRWHQAGGPPAGQNGFPNNPRVASSGCDVDHVVELQLGGSNVPANLQMLNSTDNRESGRLIWEQVSGLARELINTIPDPKPTQLLLHFDSVAGTAASIAANCKAPGTAASCTEVELCVVSQAPQAATPQGAAPTEAQTIEAGSTPANIHVRPAPSDTNLLDSGAQNLAASELVPGMILQNVNRPGQANTSDSVSACIESAACVKRTSARGTRVPLTLQGQSGLRFNIVTGQDGRRRLRLQGNQHPNVRFTYPYLSEGRMQLTYNEQSGGIEGVGTLTPSVPLLSRAVVQVRLAQGELSGTISIPPERLRLPFPGVRVTRSELGIELSPVFRPYGLFAFEIGPRNRPVIDGSLTAEADASGFIARGVINAHLPGVDQAQGNVEYRGGQWSGSIEISSSQIRLPMVQRGSLRVDFNQQGIVPSGLVVLQLPGGQTAEMSVRRRGQQWVYAGRGTFEVPGIRPVEVALEYDGEHLTGNARTGINLRGLTGDLNLRYRDGRLSGEGTLQLNRGRARGSVRARLSERLRFSGQGEIQYQLTDNLIGRVGVELFEDQRVRVSGALEFPQPVQLFRAYASEREFFRRSVDIPIVGVSIGSVSIGLIGRITGAFGARYGIGPGEIRNLRIMTAFNPLDENPDLELQAGARLVIPAYAGLSLSIRGAVGLSAGIASVTGGITATGTAELRGGLDAGVEITYRRDRFTLDAQAAIRVSPVLRLALDADVTAEAGAFGFTISRSKVWHLAAFEYGSSLQFGLVAPIHYATGEEFRMPSLSDIQWIIPDLNVNSLVPQLVGRAGSSESEG